MYLYRWYDTPPSCSFSSGSLRRRVIMSNFIIISLFSVTTACPHKKISIKEEAKWPLWIASKIFLLYIVSFIFWKDLTNMITSLYSLSQNYLKLHGICYPYFLFFFLFHIKILLKIECDGNVFLWTKLLALKILAKFHENISKHAYCNFYPEFR